MLDRDEILKKAYHECMAEMYAKAQPSADYYQLLEDAKNGKISKDERIYERHYLSHEEFKHILGKYKDAYNIRSHWEDDIEVLEKYIKEGGSNNGSSSGTGSLDFSVEGEWLYKLNGSINTSLTINSDNTFEFVGGGATSYSGSYSLSGNKITFEFDQNSSMNIKDTFVVSGSDTEMTLTLEKSVSTYNGQENVSNSMSSLLQIFYNIITSTSVTLSK